MHRVLLLILFIIVVQTQNIIRYFRDEKLGWKAKKKSYKEIIYSEKLNGKWSHLIIDSHINIGTFEPVFKNEKDWLDYPIWAQNRVLIINRVTLRYPLKNEISEIGK